MIRRRRQRGKLEPADINITAFMNLMVVLVPFLLITAVFSRIAILELNLPQEASASSESEKDDDEEIPLDLTVVVRESVVQVYGRDQLVNSFIIDQLSVVSSAGDGQEGQSSEVIYPYEDLNLFLQEMKKDESDVVESTILLEANIPYEVLVGVMDSVRVSVIDGQKEELFPEIAIGSAPVDLRGGSE